jgi:hypothetical protein
MSIHRQEFLKNISSSGFLWPRSIRMAVTADIHQVNFSLFALIRQGFITKKI